MSAAARPADRATDTGVRVGIAAVTMLFAAFTSALVVRQGAAADWLHFRMPPVVWFDTLVLVASSATIEWSRRRIDGAPALGVPAPGLRWLAATLALGLLFLAGQLVAWRALAAQGLFLATNPSSAFFYVLTALHGLHLAGGLAALAWVLRRLHRYTGVPVRVPVGAVALYWHFMGVLWLYLLSLFAIRL